MPSPQETSDGERRILRGRSVIALAAVIALALTGVGCGSDSPGGSASTAAAPASTAAAPASTAATSASTAAAPAELTTDTSCAEWLAAPADAKASALESDAAYNDGGINGWIAETRRVLAETPDQAATVPATVPVDAGVAIVDRACALVAPDDTVASAIPAYDYQAAHGGTTTP